MTAPRFVRILSILVVATFAFAILTVESHKNEKGSYAAGCPTVVDGSVELGITTIETSIERDELPLFLSLPIVTLWSGKGSIPHLDYRGPPPAAFSFSH